MRPSEDPTPPAELAADPPTEAPPAEGAAGPDPTGRYIVVLGSHADTAAIIDRHQRRHATKALDTFKHVFRGFTARLKDTQRRALMRDPDVEAVVPDERIELAGQITPTGVSRVGTPRPGTPGPRVDADVAIVDTGLDRHPDLNVAGGYDCSTSDRTLWRDRNGHGTHVAGIVAALDNDFGVVGVAPGTRLWAVKVLDSTGEGLLSWWVCGLDWILGQRDPTDPERPLFEAVNMSVAKWGSDDHACGSVNDDIVHAAICRLVAKGITVVVAAGNDHGYASRRVPAAYNEVITVSALADTDGRPGGLGGRRCYSWGTYDKDDTFANFSNFGADVDLIAPGKCIWSTVPSGYAYLSGTSMAVPTVVGAVARYKATRPAATPREVKEALQYLGNLGWNVATDPDARHERLLDVSRIGKLGTFAFVPPSTGSTIEAGGTGRIPISIKRSSTFFERVRFAVSELPAGWTSALTPSSLLGWVDNKTTLLVTVPRDTPLGVYQLTVTASNQGRSKAMTLDVMVTSDAPTATAPRARPATLATVRISSDRVPASVTMRVYWAAATDPSSAIAAYEVERRTDDGTWTGTTARDGATRRLDVPALSLSATHRFRVRARDAAGNWSPWAESADFQFRKVSDRSASLDYDGVWRRVASSTATNGVRTSSKQAGATVRTTFTGRGVALVMPRSAARGKVRVYIDGVRVATVDTYATRVQPRRIVWSRCWADTATHRLVIKVAGTTGRPSVSLDGLIITK